MGTLFLDGSLPSQQTLSGPPAGEGNRTILLNLGLPGREFLRDSTQQVVMRSGVRVNVAVKGVKAGEKCLLQVTTKNGQAVTAGSWQVSEKWESSGFTLDGSALVAPDDVKSVDIVTVDGRKLVSAQV